MLLDYLWLKLHDRRGSTAIESFAALSTQVTALMMTLHALAHHLPSLRAEMLARTGKRPSRAIASAVRAFVAAVPPALRTINSPTIESALREALSPFAQQLAHARTGNCRSGPHSLAHRPVETPRARLRR
jgi:hypothetical protein